MVIAESPRAMERAAASERIFPAGSTLNIGGISIVVGCKSRVQQVSGAARINFCSRGILFTPRPESPSRRASRDNSAHGKSTAATESSSGKTCGSTTPPIVQQGDPNTYRKRKPTDGWTPDPSDRHDVYEPLAPPPTTKPEAFDLVDQNPGLVLTFMKQKPNEVTEAAKELGVSEMEAARILIRRKMAAAHHQSDTSSQPSQDSPQDPLTSTLDRTPQREKVIAPAVVHYSYGERRDGAPSDNSLTDWGDDEDEHDQDDAPPILHHEHAEEYFPTDADPGSPEKVDIMRNRNALHLPIHHPQDRNAFASSEFDVLELLRNDTPEQVAFNLSR